MSTGGFVAAAVIAMLAVGFAVSSGPFLLHSWRRKEILAHGVIAKARVLDVTDTGNRYNWQPELAIKLEVLPSGQPPFLATVHQIASAPGFAPVAIGGLITVKYDTGDPNEVAIISFSH